MDFLRQYGGTILVLLILAAVVTGIIVKLIRDRHRGKCSCGCEGCVYSSECGKKKE